MSTRLVYRLISGWTTLLHSVSTKNLEKIVVHSSKNQN